MADIGNSIIETFDFVWDRITNRLDGLDDDEYFWEPVPACWSLRRGDDGRWRLDGGGGGGPAPDPAPVATIAWRIGHFGGLALAGFASTRFGDGSVGADTLDFPPRAAGVAGFLEAQYHSWRSGLAGLDPAGWDAPLGERFGPFAEANTVDLALHVLDELVHHGAEVALLRDLYSNREALRTHIA